MLLDRFRARKALRTRTPPAPVDDAPPAALTQVVEALKAPLDARESLGDPTWHHRWEGALHLVGLDVRARSMSDLRQRIVRLVHENELRHLPRRRKRVVVVALCEPGERGFDGFHHALEDERGEVGLADWRSARRHLAVLAVTPDGRYRLLGGDRAVQRGVAAWAAAREGGGA